MVTALSSGGEGKILQMIYILRAELNGEPLTFKPEPNKETEFNDNFYVHIDKLQAEYHFGRCQITDGLIDSCQIVQRNWVDFYI